MNRQGKQRLAKWYDVYSQKERARISKEVERIILFRKANECNFVDWKDQKIIYRRYASLFFVIGVDKKDNELISLETMHMYCVALDKYFGNVCELDLIFNFEKAYNILDEFMIGGEIQEPSVMEILKCITNAEDKIVTEVLEEAMLLN